MATVDRKTHNWVLDQINYEFFIGKNDKIEGFILWAHCERTRLAATGNNSGKG